MPDIVRCAKCRHILMLSTALVGSHGLDVDDDKNCSKGQELFSIFINDDQCPDFILEQIVQTCWTKGKLKCPRCQTTVGSHNYVQLFPCHCGEAQLPNASLHAKKVDILPQIDTSVSLENSRQKETFVLREQNRTKANNSLTATETNLEHIKNLSDAILIADPQKNKTEDISSHSSKILDLQENKFIKVVSPVTSGKSKSVKRLYQSAPTLNSFGNASDPELQFCPSSVTFAKMHNQSSIYCDGLSNGKKMAKSVSLPSVFPLLDGLLESIPISSTEKEDTNDDSDISLPVLSPSTQLAASGGGARPKHSKYNLYPAEENNDLLNHKRNCKCCASGGEQNEQNEKENGKDVQRDENESVYFMDSSRHLARQSLPDMAMGETTYQGKKYDRKENDVSLNENKCRQTAERPQFSVPPEHLDLWDAFMKEESCRPDAEDNQYRMLMESLMDRVKKRRRSYGKKSEGYNRHREINSETNNMESSFVMQDLSAGNAESGSGSPVFKGKSVCRCGCTKCLAQWAQALGEELQRENHSRSQAADSILDNMDSEQSDRSALSSLNEKNQTGGSSIVAHEDKHFQTDSQHLSESLATNSGRSSYSRATQTYPEVVLDLNICRIFRESRARDLDVCTNVHADRQQEPISLSTAQLELVRDEARTANHLVFREAFTRRRHSCSSCSGRECRHIDGVEGRDLCWNQTDLRERHRRQSEPQIRQPQQYAGVAAAETIQSTSQLQLNELGHVVVRNMREYEFRDRAREETLDHTQHQTASRRRRRNRKSGQNSGKRNLSKKLIPEEVGDEGTCAVCYEIMYRPHTVIPCQHVFCVACLWGIARHTPGGQAACPMCRRKINKCISNGGLLEELRTKYPIAYAQREQFVKKHLQNRNNTLPSSSRSMRRTSAMHRNARVNFQEPHHGFPWDNHPMSWCMHSLLIGIVIIIIFINYIFFRPP